MRIFKVFLIFITVAVILAGTIFVFLNHKTQGFSGTYEMKPYEGLNATIKVSNADSGKIKVYGFATWSSGTGEEGGVNTGDFDGEVVLNGNKGTYKDEFCQVDFTFSDNGLEARDNGQCGGFNVTFTGEYIKK